MKTFSPKNKIYGFAKILMVTITVVSTIGYLPFGAFTPTSATIIPAAQACTPTPYCGDGTVNQTSEQCDIGAQNGSICSPVYGQSCNYCSATCQTTTVQGPYCGDNIKNGIEQCDGTDGVLEHFKCTDNCTLEFLPFCGDGIVEPYEQCDDGNIANGDGCDAQCQIEAICQPGETKTDFNYNSKPQITYIDNSTTNVASELCNDSYLGVDTSDGQPHYIYLTWDNLNPSDYNGVLNFNLSLNHMESQSSIKVELKNKLGAWIEVCDPDERTGFTSDTCDLAPYALILKEVDKVELRIVATLAGACHEYLKCANLEADLYSCEAQPVCGDGQCNGEETCGTCSQDCGQCCIPEGGSGAVIPDGPSCCAGLTQIGCSQPIAPQFGGCSDCVGAFFCTMCGNGICGLGENKCNCPQDCVEPDIEYCGMYFNHVPDGVEFEGPIGGLVPGDSPFNHPAWWDITKLAFEKNDSSLTFGDNFLPVDQGLTGDPFHFTAHWRALLNVSAEGDYGYTLGSDDDSWMYINGNLVEDLGGVHAPVTRNNSVHLTQGQHIFNLYFAERHTTQSYLSFAWTTPGIEVIAECEPYCGDGTMDQTSEQCDDGNVINGDGCSATCVVEEPEPYCGDGIINQTSEQCDGTAGVGEHQSCSAECTLVNLAWCGDGLQNGTEECDGVDGVGLNQACTGECKLVSTIFCGDGVVNGNEECDGQAGVTQPHYTCSSGCTLQYIPYCGDELINQQNEECDDGNMINGDGCSAICEIESICGDGAVNQTSEQCDDGAQNGQICIPTYGQSCNYCSATCQTTTVQGPYCGDSIKNGDEQCDGTDGVSEHYTCNSQCALAYAPYCGDQTCNGGENCSTCSQDCGSCGIGGDGGGGGGGGGGSNHLVRCGDGIREWEEQCDDGNVLDGDGCSSICRTEQVLGESVETEQMGEILSARTEIPNTGENSWIIMVIALITIFSAGLTLHLLQKNIPAKTILLSKFNISPDTVLISEQGALLTLIYLNRIIKLESNN